MRTLFIFALSLACAAGSLGYSETTPSSSKALRIALEAKRAIEGHDDLSVQKATEQLESLLHESSFRRLDAPIQVRILLWLSKGYERLGKYQEQERLLSSYAKKPELYQFHTLLRTAIASSFVQQNRLIEAEHMLERCIGPSCAHLSLKEKAEIARVLSYKDEHINSLLRQADRLSETGNFSEALKVYEKILPTIEQQAHLYQASPTERQRLFHIVRLRIAELSFCLGDFQKVASVLFPWNSHLFSDQADSPFLARRLFLLASAYEWLGDGAKAQTLWQEYQTPAEDQEETDALLLWKTRKALQAGSSVEISSIADAFQRRSKAGHPLPLALKSLSATMLRRSRNSVYSSWFAFSSAESTFSSYSFSSGVM